MVKKFPRYKNSLARSIAAVLLSVLLSRNVFPLEICHATFSSFSERKKSDCNTLLLFNYYHIYFFTIEYKY